MVSVKTEELLLTDDEHYNDNAFSDHSDDDEQANATEVNNWQRNDTPVEKNAVKFDAKKDKGLVPPIAEREIKSQKLRRSFECYLCHKSFISAGNKTITNEVAVVTLN